MKFRLSVILSFAFMMTVFIGCQDGGGSAESDGAENTTVLKIATVLPEEHPSSQALAFFKEQLEEESGGAFEVQNFFNSQLGNATDAIESTQNGNVQVVFASAAPIAQFVTEFNCLNMPFIFRDKEHEYDVVDGEVGDRLAAKLEPIGLHKLCYFDAGSRNIMTKDGPVTKPEDLGGKKIRVMSSKLMTDTVNALGASAVPMPQEEVYSALQTGVIDGWENNPPTALSFKMYETGCDKFAWTQHLAVPDLLMINKELYDGLSEEKKQVLNDVAAATVLKQRELWQTSQQKAVDDLKESGMEFNDVDKDLFIERVDPIYQEAYANYGQEFQEICEAIRAIE